MCIEISRISSNLLRLLFCSGFPNKESLAEYNGLVNSHCQAPKRILKNTNTS